MMAVLGVGSGVALLSMINTVLLDAFPSVPTTLMSAGVCTVSFLIGLVYVTPVSVSIDINGFYEGFTLFEHRHIFKG